ncbi:hypothetical protein [Pseudoxanthomonas sp.]|uniref:hypothetical protein n=1 Tax=Pseudoxanthomonas sp. TaxID=1871049 RepID=UPI0028C3D39E|nr:hypothetical protein [Pseudoxanthomonas sp.]
MSSEENAAGQFASVVESMLAYPDVSHGHGKKGFGTNALNVRGKIFAMWAANRDFVIKLPEPRVQALILAGRGTPFCMAGRQMKQWVVIRPEQAAHWKALAHEAYLFGTGRTP